MDRQYLWAQLKFAILTEIMQKPVNDDRYKSEHAFFHLKEDKPFENQPGLEWVSPSLIADRMQEYYGISIPEEDHHHLNSMSSALEYFLLRMETSPAQR